MDFDIRMIGDPEAFAVNRLPARAYFNAMQPDGRSGFRSSLILDLNGEWNFEYAENYASSRQDFYKNEMDCRDWEKIKVPGHMELQGYGRPHYTNTAYPWDGNENVETGRVPEKYDPVGCYVKYFDCPGIPEGFGARIYFGGIESGGAVWLNGQFIGYKEDSFDAGEFDITKQLVPGINKLAVMVFKWTLGSWFEDQDFFRFSGIFRSVFIYSVPAVHLEDIGIRAIPDEDLKNASLKIHMLIKGSGSLSLTLFDAGTGPVLRDEVPLLPELDLDYHIPSPMLWSAEKPYLYRLVLTLTDEKGNDVERIEQNVGFRRFEIKDGIMCINGKRIEFNGVNRHEFSCFSGRSVSPEETLSDVLTMKANNINALRTSHYPDDQYLYDLCDRYGIYMIAETNMETHGTWCTPFAKEHPETILPSDHMEYEPMLFDRVRSNFEIHKNHPSILIWSVGNESFGGEVIAHMSDLFRSLDPDRPVHYEGIFNDRRRNDTSDMESQMYTSAENVKKFIEEHPEKPFILCEYSHAMGNSCGGLHKYRELMHSEPRFQGGFIWDLIDQTLMTKDRNGNPLLCYGGDFGDRPSEYSFSGNGLLYGDRRPGPKMQEVKYDYRPVECIIREKTVCIKNRQLFTGTAEYAAFQTVLKDGIKIEELPFDTDVKPLGEETLYLPYPGPVEEGEYTYIVSFRLRKATDYAPAGHEVAFDQYSFLYGKTGNPGKASDAGGFEVIKGTQNYGARNGDFSIMFSPGQGGVTSYVYGGREYIRGNRIPMPNFWRAPVDNDLGSLSPQRYAQWKIASMYLTHKRTAAFDIMAPEIKAGSGTLETTYTLRLPSNPEAFVNVRYEVRGDGRIDTTLSYDPVDGLGDMPEFGMMFILDPSLSRVRWYGRGPEETYADRKGGGKIGIWENKVADNMAAYPVPQECGNKEDVRWGEVISDEGRGLRFETLGAPMCFSALPYTPHELENAAHYHELPPVTHTVVRVSLGQMGVGGDDSWGARVLPEYLLDASGHMEFKFSWHGI
ncbi:MAG: DUF4981 domain-containing protein [Lachnospiraceae bacterium]|nr:DUF4981 domain-containing protein [Lachnospiraceae bacterium]